MKSFRQFLRDQTPSETKTRPARLSAEQKRQTVELIKKWKTVRSRPLSNSKNSIRD